MNKKEEVKPLVATSFKLKPEIKVLLEKLCEHYDRKQTNMLEVLIKDAAKKAGIK